MVRALGVVFQGSPPPWPRKGPLLQSVSRIAAAAAPPSPAFAECFKDCRPRGIAEALFCRAFQGLPPPRPRRGPLLQSVSRIPAPAAWPRPALATWFKDCGPRGSSEACFWKVFQGFSPQAAPPRPVFAKRFKECVLRGPSEARFCRVFQGLEPPRLCRDPLLQATPKKTKQNGDPFERGPLCYEFFAIVPRCNRRSYDASDAAP